MKKLLRLDWDLIAGILAAVIALVLHLLHVVNEEVLMAVALFLLALLLLRDLRAERQTDEVLDIARDTQTKVDGVLSAVQIPDTVLIGPQNLREKSEQFARNARGEMIWFNVCLLMFKPQDLFDTLVKPALDNPLVGSMRFILDKGQKDLWENEVRPKIMAAGNQGKVAEPHWCLLDESVSFVLAGTHASEKPEALLSFWGEPFMSKSTGRDIPRYIFYVHSHSELVSRLSELERSYRLIASEESGDAGSA